MDPANRRAVTRLAGHAWPLGQRISSLAPLVCAGLVQAALRADASSVASRWIGASGQHDVQGTAPPPVLHTTRPRQKHLANYAAGSVPRSMPAPTAAARSCGSSTVLRTTLTCAMPACLWRIVRPRMPRSTAAMSRQNYGLISPHKAASVHTPPKKGMLNPPPWDKAIYARRHHVENTFSRLKDYARIALRRDKTRRS